MNILFAIQGTGNGHLSRAADIYPELCRYGTVDVLISGIQADVAVPFPVTYRLYGMSFIFGKRGGIALWKTVSRLRPLRLNRDIRALPVHNYDLIINDFEPVSAWACRLHKKQCISLSHQCAVLDELAPKPAKESIAGKWVLRNYAPVTDAYGFNFRVSGPNIFTPVIRRQVRELSVSDEGHYTVYLPAYDDGAIIRHLSQFPDTKWQVFSKHNRHPLLSGNISVRKIDNEAFTASMATAAGVLCGAGFEGPAEAMYLGKKVLVIPMKAQYEQQCNAVGARDMGAAMIPELAKKYYPAIKDWLTAGVPVSVNYPDRTKAIIEQIMREHAPSIK